MKKQHLLTSGTVRFKQHSLIVFTAFMVAISFFLAQGCKKSEEKVPAATKKRSMQRDANAVYTMSDYQTALNDVQYDGNGHLVFNNMNHLQVVTKALDSLGDSTAIAWENSLGFSSIKAQFKSVSDAYTQMVDNSNSTSASTAPYTQSQIEQYWSANSNVAIMTTDGSDINASDPILAWVIGSDHKVYVDDYVIYSDINNFISIPQANESSIANYVSGSDNVNDSTSRTYVSKAQKLTGTSSQLCVTGINTTSYLNDIQCGSPLQYKSTVNCQVANTFAWTNCGISGYVNMYVNIHNYVRGWWGNWYDQKRGMQVSGYFNGAYYFDNYYINNNEQIAHSYWVAFSLHQCMTFSQYVQLMSTQWCFKGGVCVAPMCGGVTMCENFQ